MGGAQLRGSGRVPENVVAFQQYPANSPDKRRSLLVGAEIIGLSVRQCQIVGGVGAFFEPSLLGSSSRRKSSAQCSGTPSTKSAYMMRSCRPAAAVMSGPRVGGGLLLFWSLSSGFFAVSDWAPCGLRIISPRSRIRDAKTMQSAVRRSTEIKHGPIRAPADRDATFQGRIFFEACAPSMPGGAVGMLATLSDRLRAAGILIETYANEIPGDVASLNDAGVP